MSEPFLGEIRMWTTKFVPRGWAECNGQLLQIAFNQALFSILGTTYGGDGKTTFALPDLRFRSPRHQGIGPGLAPVTLGERAGEETHLLTAAEVPPHTHALLANSSEPANLTQAVAGSSLARSNVKAYGQATRTTTTQMSDLSVSAGGGDKPVPHNNMQPYIAVRFCIATQGIFPARD
jgi:microcystin-dependent protein